MASHFYVNYGAKLYDVYLDRLSATGFTLKCSEYSVSADGADDGRLRLVEHKEKLESLTLMTRTSSAAILECRVLTLAENRFRVPCILIGRRCDNEPTFLNLMLVTLIPSSTASAVSVKLMHARSLKITNAAHVEPALADGPIVHFVTSRFLYINYYEGNATGVVTLKIAVSDVTSLGRIVAFRATYDRSPDTLAVIGRLDFVVNHTAMLNKAVTVQFRPKEKDFTVVNSLVFVHNSQRYISVAIAGAFVDDGQQYCTSPTSTWPTMRFVTRDSQLVEIGSKLNVTNVCSIQLENAVRLLHYQRTSSSRKYVIVKSRDDTCCVVDLDSFQVIRSFTRCNVFVGDFMMRGAPEVLVVHAGKALLDCKVNVTDLEQDVPLEGIEKNEADPTEPSFVAAKRALISRSTLGREAVSKVRGQLESTSRMLDEACGILREVAIGHERGDNIARKPHLFQLLNGERTSASPSVDISVTPRRESCCRRPIGVGRPWQRIVDRNWIIGVRVVNLSSGPVHDLHLVLTTARRSLLHSTRVFKMKNISFQSETADDGVLPRPSKRPKLNNDVCRPDAAARMAEKENCLQTSETVLLTTSLAVEVLQQEAELPVNVYVTFRWQIDDKLVPGCLSCSTTILRMRDLLHDVLRNNWTEGKDRSELLCDLAALEVTTEKFQVNFISKETDLSGLTKLIEDVGRFTLFGRESNVLVWTSANRAILEGVWMEVASVEDNHKAHVILHARNRSQFFVCIEYLYGVLPEDILIVPFMEEVTVRPTVTSAMSQEVNLIVDFFDSNGPFVHCDTLESKALSVSVTESYRDFRNALFKLEMKTDKIFGANFATKKNTSK